MLNRFFRGLAKRVIGPPVRMVVAAGISPNAVTLTGFGVTLAACWLIAGGRLFAGGLVLGAAGIFDMVDGAVAKVGGKASTAGAFLDSTVDRLSDSSLFLAIFWHYRQTDFARPAEVASGAIGTPIWGTEAQLGMASALGALVLGFLVSYIKARAEGLGMECKVGLAERPERVVLPVLGLLLDRLVPALGLLVLLSMITAVQRFVHVWRRAGSVGADAA